MTPPGEHRIALFIDFENLVTNTGIAASRFDLQPALDRLLERGKVIFRRAYCDWSRFREATRRLHEAGVELIDVPPSTRAGKNGADIRLVIDALELCYAREHIDTFVIASGDSDFCPLAYKLRENDKTVIGLAVRSASSPFFIKACDEFVYLKPHERDQEAPRKERDAKEAKPRPQRGERPAADVPELAREVVKSMLAAATGPLNPSAIKAALTRREPDFDEREHGFSTFAKLLAALEKEGLLRRQQHGRQWYVVPPEAPPATSEAAAADEPDA